MVRIFLRSSGESPSHPTRSNSASRATGEIAVHLDYSQLMVTDTGEVIRRKETAN